MSDGHPLASQKTELSTAASPNQPVRCPSRTRVCPQNRRNPKWARGSSWRSPSTKKGLKPIPNLSHNQNLEFKNGPTGTNHASRTKKAEAPMGWDYPYLPPGFDSDAQWIPMGKKHERSAPFLGWLRLQGALGNKLKPKNPKTLGKWIPQGKNQKLGWLATLTQKKEKKQKGAPLGHKALTFAQELRHLRQEILNGLLRLLIRQLRQERRGGLKKRSSGNKRWGFARWGV